jgi:protein-arginine kinase activator protein McsA
MIGFTNQILAELKSNTKLAAQPLVKMLIESIDKSTALGESEKQIYLNLKEGIATINSTLKDKNLSSLLEQFTKVEATPEAKVNELAKAANLTKKLEAIRNSKAIANPMISTQVSIFESKLKSGIPDFSLCESFVNVFTTYAYEPTVKVQVAKVTSYLAENRSTNLMLSAIYAMDSLPVSNYSGVSKELKSLLVTESYTSDILKLKFGNTIPYVTQLVNDLRLLESQTLGYFTMGEGDAFTRVSNMIAPATQAKDGLIVYTDNRFVSIRESKGLTGKEKTVYVDGAFKIAEVDPGYVKEKFPKFFSVAEAFASLGFEKVEEGVTSKSIRNFNLSFKTNENKELDLYLNESKVENTEDINIMEALALESDSIKQKVMTLFENSKNLFNFDFIKELKNDRTLAEAIVFKLNDLFYVCEKANSADRNWMEVDEFKLYEFCMNNFNYDISPIFKTKIDARIEDFKVIESKKEAIMIDVKKLEDTLEKLQKTISNPEVEKDAVKKLQGIKESIEATINTLKEDYVGLDILKKSASLAK